jgi:hypothetical protein
LLVVSKLLVLGVGHLQKGLLEESDVLVLTTEELKKSWINVLIRRIWESWLLLKVGGLLLLLRLAKLFSVAVSLFSSELGEASIRGSLSSKTVEFSLETIGLGGSNWRMSRGSSGCGGCSGGAMLLWLGSGLRRVGDGTAGVGGGTKRAPCDGGSRHRR